MAIYKESSTVELKRELTADCKKEIVALANTDGGTLYIGVDNNGNVFGVEPPMFVELQITETDPGFKGDTVNNTQKPATLETGAQIRVPLFVESGEIIKIDTRTGEYLERVQK